GRHEGGARGLVERLHDDPVRGDVDVPQRGVGGVPAGGGRVQPVLGRREVGQGPADDRGPGALLLDGGDVRRVGGGDRQLAGGGAAHPGAGEPVAEGGAQDTCPGARLRLVDQAFGRLGRGQFQVPPEGLEQVRRGPVGAQRLGGAGHRPGGGGRFGGHGGRGRGQGEGAEGGQGRPGGGPGVSVGHAVGLLRSVAGCRERSPSCRHLGAGPATSGTDPVLARGARRDVTGGTFSRFGEPAGRHVQYGGAGRARTGAVRRAGGRA